MLKNLVKVVGLVALIVLICTVGINVKYKQPVIDWEVEAAEIKQAQEEYQLEHKLLHAENNEESKNGYNVVIVWVSNDKDTNN